MSKNSVIHASTMLYAIGFRIVQNMNDVDIDKIVDPALKKALHDIKEREKMFEKRG